MPRLTDELEALEHDLFRYPGTDESAHLNRRLILRKALQAWGDGRYAEGLADGHRDVHDARRLARDAEAAAGEVSVSRDDLRAVTAEAIPADVRERFLEALGEGGGSD